MSEKMYQKPSESDRVTAQQLRQNVADHLIVEAAEKAAKARKKDQVKQDAYNEFMERRFTENDRVRIRKQVELAADRQLFELEVLKFPSEYLEDHGRRINNGERDWPDSLMGYAKEIHEAYNDLAKPGGFKLIARVLGYPNGMIGDIGLYVSWK